MQSSKQVITETQFGFDEMAVTFDDYRKFEWCGIQDEFGIFYLACFEEEPNEDAKMEVISILRSVIRKLLHETDSTSLFDPKQLLSQNKERCIELIEEGLKNVKTSDDVDEIDEALEELMGGKTDLEHELRQAVETGPEVSVSFRQN